MFGKTYIAYNQYRQVEFICQALVFMNISRTKLLIYLGLGILVLGVNDALLPHFVNDKDPC